MKEPVALDRFEIRLSGLGGQGILTLGKLLGHALALGHGYYVTQTQSYGPEARGGASRADLVVSSRPISYPKTERLDLLVALSQEACNSYHHLLKPTGVLLVDTGLVRQIPTNVYLGLPFTELALERVKVPQATNVVALGAVTFLLPFARREVMRKSLLATLPEKIRKVNLKAFALGFDQARKLLERPMDLMAREAENGRARGDADLTDIMVED
ncbi:MAG: pyruvate ferredoxin oxidoreductase [Desulfovibrio sp.]|nr:pyruvate ferredoxin oxidoreductase [Desulfovibrio sp.]